MRYKSFKSDLTKEKREKTKTQSLICYVTEYITIKHENFLTSRTFTSLQLNWKFSKCIGNLAKKFHNLKCKKASQFDEFLREK